MTLYSSDQVHMSVPKAADILGIGREQVRLVKSDERFRLDVRELRDCIDSDLRAGLRPFCVVASAGTVNTGAVDPLEEAADVAREHGLWLHVDGAYGALAALDEQKRALFRGIELADSVSLDAHKWLYAPVDAGCLLLRDEGAAQRAFGAGEADYIKVHEREEQEAFAFWDYGVELSRRFRALKIWLMLRYYGLGRVAAAVSKDNRLAAEMGERVRASSDMELMAPVELSICCFRYVPQHMRERLESGDEAERERVGYELDALNARVMHTIQRSGRAYLSNATLGGRYCLRACITNYRATSQDVAETLDIVRSAAHSLTEG